MKRIELTARSQKVRTIEIIIEIIIVLAACSMTVYNIHFQNAQKPDRLQKGKIAQLIIGNGVDEHICSLGKEFNSDSSVIDGIFPVELGEDKEGYLVVLKPNSKTRIPHALSIYHRYIAVVDPSMNRLLADPKCLEADEGFYSVLRTNDRSYLLFLGSTQYQGDIDRCGGLYEVGSWKRIWPANNVFWKNFSVDYRDGNLQVFKQEATGLVYSYSLSWDEKTGSLVKTAERD